DGQGAAGRDRAADLAAAGLQHDRDERARPAADRVPARRADVGDLPGGAAVLAPGRRHRAVQLRRPAVLGLLRRLGRGAGPPRPRARRRGGVRGAARARAGGHAVSAAQRLTQLDRAFLIYEDPSAPMHVGATAVFEAAPLRNDAGGVDLERIEAYVASRLHRIPRYRQRLAWTPLERHPVWVDDPRFQLRYHVRHTRLPRPGSERQLKRVVG